MTEIHFLITEKTVNAMTWDEFEVFELAQEGQLKLSKIKPVLARFMVDGAGLPVDHKQAVKVLGELPISKIRETLELFVEQMKLSTVPKSNGSQSESPSAPASAGSPSPTG